MTEAPTTDPMTGRLEEAPLVGAGAGADSAAKAALTEAAANRTAQAIFFISIAANKKKRRPDDDEGKGGMGGIIYALGFAMFRTCHPSIHGPEEL
ncbi:hypothetical protein MLD38_002798 [Melastoma candidum]|uniref:Uncharacterized protein n=1 Tax=Melastoma candidum TaxID=119954 RepID=A0ACB9S4A8_9MYRT|nr:hypothetical protein MLD38_002798 [Melastoma candidum]